MRDQTRYPTTTFGHTDPKWRSNLISPKAIEDLALAKGLMVRKSNSGDFSIRSADGKKVYYSCQLELLCGVMLIPGDQRQALDQLAAELKEV